MPDVKINQRCKDGLLKSGRLYIYKNFRVK